MATSKKIMNLILTLRILTLLVLAASIVIMCLNNFKLNNGSKVPFTTFLAYRYVVTVGAIGFVYTLIQIPFAAYHVFTQKRFTSNGCLPEFDFYGDKLISYILATGVGVGFGLTIELKRFLKQVFNTLQAFGATDIDEFRSKDNKFINNGIISTAILFLGFLLMAIISLLTSNNRSQKLGLFV